MNKWWLPAIFIAFCLHAEAQFSITGTVRNNLRNEPLPGAHIHILNSQMNAVSDFQGNFTISNLKNGITTLVTTYMGYKEDTMRIELSKAINITIRLQEKPILEDEVIIESTRAGIRAPLSFQDISQARISAANFGQDLPLLLSSSISAVSTSDAGNGMGYTALRIRGTDMTRINVTVNGIPLNDPESHNVFWVDLPDIAGSTDNIQIQRGVGTSTNGASAFGASINLMLSRLRKEPFGEMATSIGSFNSQRITGIFGTGIMDKHWSMEGRISRLHSDGYINRASSDLFSYYVSTAYSNPKNILRFNLISGSEKTYQAWDGVPSNILDTNRRYNGMGAYYERSGKLKYYDNETDNYKQTHYQLHYSHQFGPEFYLNASAHYTRGFGYYEQYKDDDELDDYGIPAVRLPGSYFLAGHDTVMVADSLISYTDLIRRKWLDNDFAGLTYSLNWNRGRFRATLGGSWNTYLGRHFGRIIWTEYATGIEPDYEWYRSKSDKKDFNIYNKWNFEISQKFSLFADLQLRRIHYSIEGIDDDLRIISQEHQFLFFNPKSGVFITLNSSNQVFASFAIAHREPNRDNYVDANPQKALPQPETLYDLEIGHQHRQQRLSISENIYLMYYRDQLALTGAINDVGAPVMENIPDSYRLGLELALNLRVTKALQWDFTSTFSRNKIIRFIEYVDDWDTWEQVPVVQNRTDLAFSPSLLANSELTWTASRSIVLSLVSKYVGKQYIDNSQSDQRALDDYFLNDVRLSCSLKPLFCKEILFRLSINNFLNHRYESNAWVYRYLENNELKVLDGYFPQAGINFNGGLSIKF